MCDVATSGRLCRGTAEATEIAEIRNESPWTRRALRSDGERRHGAPRESRVVLRLIAIVPRRRGIVFGRAIRIAAHPVKRQRRDAVRTRRVDVHLLAVA